MPCTLMSKPPSDKPPDKPMQQTIAPSVPKPDQVKPEVSSFGLSAAQFALVKRAMLAVARSECRHSGGCPEDAVQQAFVKALSKPIGKRQSIHNEKKFIAWLCELTKWEATTNRTSHRRRAVREVVSDADITEMVVVPPSVGTVEARKMLDPAIMELKPEDRAFLHALYTEGKTIADIAQERGLPWTTVDSRHKRILELLYAAIQAAIAALVLLVPKKARAFVANIAQQAPHVVVQGAQFTGAMTVTAVCGVLLPTGSSAMAESLQPVGLTTYNTPQTTVAQATGLEPSFVSEVEPEEPKALDAETNQCSAADMKSTKIASFLQETLVPLAFVVAPAFTQVACSGSGQQTPPAKQPEEDADYSKETRLQMQRAHYEGMCLQQRARGDTCPTWEEWHKE